MHIAYSTLSMIDDRSTLNVPALRSFSFKSEEPWGNFFIELDTFFIKKDGSNSC